jgi:serine protease
MQLIRRLAGFLAGLALVAASSLSIAQESRVGLVTAGEPIDQLIVKYRKEPVAARLADNVLAARGVTAKFGVSINHKRLGALGAHVMKLDSALSASDAAKLAADLRASDPNIEYAEPDRRMYPAMVPNDTRYNEQWHYFDPTGGINLPAAWDLATGAGVRVAVLDTGYRPHPDLVAGLIGGYDFISNTTMSQDADGRDSDPLDPGDWQNALDCFSAPWAQGSTWHGTHVAGTIAARTNNSLGVAGVAFGAQVVPVRVLGRCGGQVSDIADGIVWASGGSVPGVPANPYPAKVLNLSIGARTAGACESTYQNAINSANSRGSVVVISAGNSNDIANYSPGNCAGVVTVAATNSSGGKAGYSNAGSAVEIAAPGGEAPNSILSTHNNGATTPFQDTYQVMNGTSMAAPHVAGVVALMWSKLPGLTSSQLKNTLYATARSFPVACPGCGFGIVNAAAAVAALNIPAPSINDAIYAGCNGSYQMFWNAIAGASSYKVWRKTPSAAEISLYGTSTFTSAVVVAPMGAGLTAFHVQACQGSTCGVVGNAASLPYYSGCP